MTVLHYAYGSHKGTCIYSIEHLLVFGSLVLGSEIFFNILYFQYFYIFLYFFSSKYS